MKANATKLEKEVLNNDSINAQDVAKSISEMKATENATEVPTKSKKSNAYTLEVLEVNANFKKALRNTGKAFKLLAASECLTTDQLNTIKALQKSDDLYKTFDATVRRTKTGDVTAFYVLQALYRSIKANGVPKVTTKAKAKK